ncbi:MAG: DedA family protein [Rhodospirillales bacterium]|nr:DedA family protein [Rhodospirillales bacterium]
MLRRLYDWTLELAKHPQALWALALISFIESSIFPIPPDIILIPMVLAARDRAWVIAGVCTLASVIGGMLGYGIGAFMFEQIGRPILDFYHYAPKFDQFREAYNQWGAWAVFTAGVTPFPYKIITILSGVTGLDPVVFTISSVLARGMRFFLVAALLWKFGDPIRRFIEKRLGLLFVLFVVTLFGGFLLVKVVF